jgi:hypothetical protein
MKVDFHNIPEHDYPSLVHVHTSEVTYSQSITRPTDVGFANLSIANLSITLKVQQLLIGHKNAEKT